MVFSWNDEHGSLYATELVHVSGIVAVNEHGSPVRSYFEFRFSRRICIDGVGIFLQPHGHDVCTAGVHFDCFSNVLLAHLPHRDFVFAWHE